MDGLTANVALVIDNDQDQLAQVCRVVRKVGRAFDREGHDVWTREEYIAFEMADTLCRRVMHDLDTLNACLDLPQPTRQFVAIALAHMDTSVNWIDLARHYMTKEAENAA